MLFACSLSLFAGTREETMEERKRRITRKYLQERADITYSDTVVPDAVVEAEEVLASEKYKDVQIDLKRQEPGARMPPSAPPPRSRLRAANPNWLLADETEAEDPYANPFALKETKEKPREKTGWTAWGTERDSSTYTAAERESQFNWRSRDTKRSGLFGSQDASAKDARPQGSTLNGRGLFGRKPATTRSPYSTGGLDLSRDKTFAPTTSQSALQSSFLRTPAQSTGQSGSKKQQGYIPYKGTYPTQRDPWKERQDGYAKPAGQEPRKKDAFQKWKERDPQQIDPMRDDAFITEMMPKTRR